MKVHSSQRGGGTQKRSSSGLTQEGTLDWRKTPVLDRTCLQSRAQGWGGVDESVMGVGFSPGCKCRVA